LPFDRPASESGCFPNILEFICITLDKIIIAGQEGTIISPRTKYLLHPGIGLDCTA